MSQYNFSLIKSRTFRMECRPEYLIKEIKNYTWVISSK